MSEGERGQGDLAETQKKRAPTRSTVEANTSNNPKKTQSLKEKIFTDYAKARKIINELLNLPADAFNQLAWELTTRGLREAVDTTYETVTLLKETCNRLAEEKDKERRE